MNDQNMGTNITKIPTKSSHPHKSQKRSRFKRVRTGIFRYRRTGIYYGIFKRNGKTKWKNLRTNDLRLARRLLVDLIKSIPKYDWKLAGFVTLQNLVDLYERNPMNLAVSTFKARNQLLSVFKSTWSFGLEIKARDVKPFMMRSWLADRRNERTLKAAGINNYVRLLHGLFALAVDLESVSENPALQIKLLREPNPERLTPTWDQAHNIIAAVKLRDSRKALSAMLLFGLGQAELRNLRGEHFDLVRGIVTIRRQKTQRVFMIPIFPQARQFVEELRDAGELNSQMAVFRICNPQDAIFLACQRLNYPSFTPRSFRRAFIIRALEKGIDPRVVAAWQGHRDATLVLRVYGAWINQDHAKRMAALMS